MHIWRVVAMIDTVAILQSVDLLAAIGADTALKKAATTNGGEYAGPCPGCGGRDRFRVWPTPHEGKPGYWCRECGKKGDAIQYRVDFHGETFREAVAYYGGGPALPGPRPTAAPRPPAQPAPMPDLDAPGPAWQARARAFVAETQAALWSDTGAKALAWLHDARGLTDATIRAAGLGYNGAERYEDRAAWGLLDTGDGKRVWQPRGVVIPCDVGGAIWYIKTRRPVGDPKYVHIPGGRPALYLAEKSLGKPDVFITEGEFDALLLWQTAWDVADVLTLGSASGRLGGLWPVYLLAARRFHIATDTDDAGDKAAAAWLQLVGAKGQRVALPGGQGKDITDAWKAGQDLRAWAMGQLGTAGEIAQLESQLVAVGNAWHLALERGDQAEADRIDAEGVGQLERLNSLLRQGG
jgi:DNA primase